MELATVIGLVVGWGVMILANSLEGGHLSSLWQYTAFLIVVGGTVGAAFISFPMKDMLNLPQVIGLTFRKSPYDAAALIPMLSGYADKARREGLLALESELAGTDDEFLRKGLQMVADGIDPHTVRELMETELTFIASRHAASFGILEAMGGYAPTMGIIGTVMGLIHVLGNLSEPAKLGSAIAVAFVATLYGVWTANLLWLPLATKLKRRSEEEILAREMMVTGILSIQAGENPQIVEDKLKGFLAPKLRSGLKVEEAVR
jgi:chemotaxis protein MotA